jgi:uroporphyrinogen-III synthase
MSMLAGRRVVVTRAAEQADELVDLLRTAGAVPVVVPLIEIVAEPAAATELAALDIDGFEWLVVTSPNGAQAYASARRQSPSAEIDADPVAAPPCVAAVGTTTAAALASVGVVASLVPAVQRATGLLAEFPAGTGRVLLVQAVAAEPTLADGLAALGWQVTAVCPYRSRPAHPTAGQQLAALSADAVLFASGSSARAWVEVFGTTTPPIVVAIGPQTARAVVQAGLKVALVAADHSVPGLVAELERHLSTTG